MDQNFNGFVGFPMQNSVQTTCGCGGGTSITPENITSGGSMQRALTNYLGRRVTCDFCGQGNNTRKTGILSGVGTDYLLLTNNGGGCMLCDTQNLKFVTIGG